MHLVFRIRAVCKHTCRTDTVVMIAFDAFRDHHEINIEIDKSYIEYIMNDFEDQCKAGAAYAKLFLGEQYCCQSRKDMHGMAFANEQKKL